MQNVEFRMTTGATVYSAFLIMDPNSMEKPTIDEIALALKEKFGDGLTKLVDMYSIEALKRKARAKGYNYTERQVAGKTQLVVSGF